MIDILLLEDSPLDADLIGERLRLGGLQHRTRRVVTREEFQRAVGEETYDVILADYSLPSFDGMAALEIARETAPETPFIFVSATLGEEIAVESLKRGATDYVVKQRLQRLPAAIERALSEARDRAERRRAEERQRLLVAELDHRVKNMLATVRSLVHQTRHGARTCEDFASALDGRLQALARAHASLSRTHWEGGDLKGLVADELAAYQSPDGRRVEIEGHELMVDPKAAQSLALAMHELATNAAKYGSLTRPEGRVRVEWRRERDCPAPRLRIAWTESGGPRVAPPAEQGFGTRLLPQVLAHDLDAEVEMDWRPEGLICAILLPGWHIAPAASASRPEARDDAPQTVAPRDASGPMRVLVVEDEALIAFQVVDALEELGWEVVGPAASVPAALALARSEPLDGAILDVNLRGSDVYPVAEVLDARGVPFVFTTGYRAVALREPYRDRPKITKPYSSDALVASITRAFAPAADAPVRTEHPDDPALRLPVEGV